MANSFTTLAYKSNVYPIESSFQQDRKFLSQIRDPFSLENMKLRGFHLTDVQQKEYDCAAVHCTYAFEKDYPWGTIILADGTPTIVCKCTNIKCSYFKKCRPDYDASEHKVYEENRIVQCEIASLKKRNQDIVHEIEADAVVAVEKLFSGETVAPETKTDEDLLAIDASCDINDSSGTIPKADTSSSGKLVPVLDFFSFVNTTQNNIIKSAATDRIIVNAGPGTGKTWTLIERIINMVDEQGVSPDNILVLCFSRAAVEVIQNRLSDAVAEGRLDHARSEIDIRTFDSFATYMLTHLPKEMSELLPAGFLLEEKDYEQRIQQATKILADRKDMLAEYEQIIVDEVQDLVGNRAEMVIALLSGLPETCGFTILGDSCQALYDYLAVDDPSVMTSDKFYHELFRLFPHASFYSLTENHRQDDNLGASTIPYRNAILNGTAITRSAEAFALLTGIPAAAIRLQHFSKAEAEKYIRQGTLGILTRTNGQALQISSWLRNEGVSHDLQRDSSMSGLGDWISKVFYRYKNETVDESSFIAHHMSVFPFSTYDKAKERWYALVNSQIRGASKTRYEVRDLLFELIRNSREPELYRSDADNHCVITVSNIHRAKGREFDSVIMIDDVIQSVTKPDNDDILEHKVCYVALTRPKRKIEHIKLPTQYIYIAKNASRRCSKASSRTGKKPYISHFEVCSDDLNVFSFADTRERQALIQNDLQTGMRLKLKKCPEQRGKYITYSVVLEDQEKTVLGYTGRKFAEELESAIQRILGITSRVYYKVFPHAFCDVYVETVTSHISSGTTPNGARTFGDVAIWSGFTISGFAAVDRDTY